MTDISEDFLALLAHELRTPVAAIIGYHDLMSEGIFGDIDPRIAESLNRIRSSADQLLALVASLGEAGIHDSARLHVDIDSHDPREIVDNVITRLASEANGRATTIDVQNRPDSSPFRTDAERVERALMLALHAAIKNSAGGTLTLNTHADSDALICTLERARLQPQPDFLDHDLASALTAHAMRLAMAAQAIRPIGGTIAVSGSPDNATVTIRIPRSD
jgi:signal transduction histidine kinase